MSDTAFRGHSRRSQLIRLRELAKEVLKAHGLQDARLSLIQHWLNTTFRVDVGKARFALRIQRTGLANAALVRSELQWLVALKQEAGVAVPEPVLTPDGQLFLRLQVEASGEPRFCTLFKWLDGRFLGRSRTPEHARLAGGLLAKIHRHSETFVPPEGFFRPTWDSSAMMGSVLDVDLTRCKTVMRPDDWAVVEEMGRLVEERMDAMERSPLTFGMIHGDFHQENYLFHGHNTGVIDFDLCGWGYYLYDIAVSFSTIVGRNPNYAALRNAFLDGYLAGRYFDLSDQNKATIEMFIAARKMARALALAGTIGMPGWEGSESRVLSEVEYVRRYLVGK